MKVFYWCITLRYQQANSSEAMYATVSNRADSSIDRKLEFIVIFTVDRDNSTIVIGLYGEVYTLS